MNMMTIPEIWCDEKDGLTWADKLDHFKAWIEAGVKSARKQHKPAFVYHGRVHDPVWLILDSGDIQPFIRKWHIKISDDLRSYDGYWLVAKSD